MEHKISFVLTLFTIYFTVVQSFVCNEDICSMVKCRNEICEPGQAVKRGGVCNCCDVCYTLLGEGETCTLLQSAILSPRPNKVVCDEGLLCFENKCQKEKDVVDAYQGS